MRNRRKDILCLRKPVLALVAVFCLVCASASFAAAQGWQWVRTGTGVHSDAWAVAADAAGNVFGASEIYGIGTIHYGGLSDSSSGYQVGWVKYDSSGTPLWSGCTVGGRNFLNNICADSAGNLFVYGAMMDFSVELGPFLLTDTLAWYHSSVTKYFLAKVSPSGTVLWALNDGVNFELNGLANVPDTPVTYYAGITADAHGNVYICGSFRDSTVIGPYTFHSAGGDDAFVAKYSPSGTLLWANAIGGAATDKVLSIATSPAGNVYICGYTNSPSIVVGSSTIGDPYARSVAFIAAFSPGGAPLWAQAPGGYDGSIATGVTSDDSGYVYMTGGFGDNTISFGSTTLARPYPSSVARLAMFVVRYSSTGAATWARTIASRSRTGVFGYGVSTYRDQVWVAGLYKDTANIDMTLMLPPPMGYEPVFVAGWDNSGCLVNYASLNSGGDDMIGMTCDRHGNVLVGSDIEVPLLFGPDTIRGIGFGENFYVAKYRTGPRLPDTTCQHTDTVLCAASGDTVVVTAPPGYTSYYWNDFTTGPVHAFHTPGTYWVCGATCAAVLIDTVRITAAGTDTVTHVSDTAVCKYGDSPISVSLGSSTGAGHYTWSTGDTALSINIVLPGVYWVAHGSHCTLYIDSFVVAAIPGPVAIAGDDTICVGDVTTLSDGVSGGTWTSRNGGIASIDSVLGVVTGLSPGIDTIIYAMAGGCFVSRLQVVLAPPCDHINSVGELSVTHDIEMFPVPVQKELTVQGRDRGYCSFGISNTHGQLLLTRTISSRKTVADVSSLPAGLYYITFYSCGNGADRVTRKFIKE